MLFLCILCREKDQLVFGLLLEGMEDGLFANLRLRNSLCPDTAICVFQLLHDLAGIVFVVFVDYDIHFRMALCHGDWPAGQDGDLCNSGCCKHGVQDSRAYEAGRARENEMHYCL